MQTLTEKQFKERYGTQGVELFKSSATTNVEPGYASRVGGAFQKAGTDIVSGIKNSAQDIATGTAIGGISGVAQAVKGVVRSGLRTAGGVVSAAIAPITEAPVVKDVMQSVGSGIGSAISNVDIVRKIAEVSDRHPEAAKDIQNLVDLLTVGAGKVAEAPIAGGIKSGLVKTGEAIAQGANAVGDLAQPVKNLVGGVADAGKLAIEGASRIPARITTNLAEKKAVQESIKALPTESARKAVQDGVDVNDIKYFTTIDKAQKVPVAKLVKAVQDFESGASKVNPIEVVGKPIITRMSELNNQRKVVGKRLGDVSKTLGEVSTKEATGPVFEALKGVSGLEGLQLTSRGLNFKNTVLASAETASDRKAIKQIFNTAIKNGNGENKHLLRQELREALGGKKKAGVQITGTQEAAYEAIRKGLSNVLDLKNPQYKALNNEYRKISKPLADFTRELKLPGETDKDILNMGAGILARRITSNAPSNPKIMSILKSLDSATAKKGVTRTSVETLQNVVNIMSKYYNIDQKTGFKALTQEATAAGMKDFVSNAVSDIAGKTDAVRKKAFEDAIKELLSN